MDELTQLRQQIADLEKELESVMYSISHDLRAPLRAVQGFAQALSEDYGDKVDGEAKKYLEVIDTSSKQMSAMIDGLLSLSRISRQKITPEKLDINELVNGTVLEFKQKLASDRIEFRVDDLPRCTADAALVRQAFSQLIANAVKFSSTKPKALIEIGGKQDGGQNVYFVRDNGVGFDMKYATRLFWLYHRLHTEPEFAGVGAGLAMVRLIARRHGGKVWAEAEPNKGACFYLSLPGV